MNITCAMFYKRKFMKLKLFTSILPLSIALFASAQTDTLYVYGLGGPQAAIDEYAKTFSKKMSVLVKVITGPEANWIEQ